MSVPFSLKKVLIANRGEIACRIIRTCRKLGIKTIAICSPVDRQALHVRMADEVGELSENESVKSYLDIKKIVSLARAHGADAVHPGYGFLSENRDFAEALEEAGIVFIGPTSKAIELLGDKIKAKKIAEKAKAPLLSSLPLKQSPRGTSLKTIEKAVGFPLMIKAAAGGGGRGMRRVSDPSEFEASVAAAKREALASFGDDSVYVERLIESAKHVEIQIMGDAHGNVMHFHDRDCSLQRHHQKVIEEAPAAWLPKKTRETLFSLAVSIGKLAKYRGAGTVEFLIDEKGRYYFLEVNTRLQVEHPVTEAITGVDLVELQIRVAAGENLKQIFPKLTAPEARGYAIECRLCAESPEENFTPATGILEGFTFHAPSDPDLRVRIDTGFTAGDKITHYYDSLLAKLIVRGDSRAAALQGSEELLQKSEVWGIKTNQGYLLDLLRDPSFRSAAHHTRTAHALLPSDETVRERRLLAGALFAVSRLAPVNNPQQLSAPTRSAWRMQGSASVPCYLEVDGIKAKYLVTSRMHDFSVQALPIAGATQSPKNFSLTVSEWDEHSISYTWNGESSIFRRERDSEGRAWALSPFGYHMVEEFSPALRPDSAKDQKHDLHLSSPLPGKVVEIKIAVGDTVCEGEALIVIESMKMEHLLKAMRPGKVRDLLVKRGDVVEARAPLAVIE